jgi:hypothetical protein
MGWWNSHLEDLEPETRNHIEGQRGKNTSEKMIMYSCGCEMLKTDPGLLHLCLWHEGFDEGASLGRYPTELVKDGN